MHYKTPPFPIVWDYHKFSISRANITQNQEILTISNPSRIRLEMPSSIYFYVRIISPKLMKVYGTPISEDHLQIRHTSVRKHNIKNETRFAFTARKIHQYRPTSVYLKYNIIKINFLNLECLLISSLLNLITKY